VHGVQEELDQDSHVLLGCLSEAFIDYVRSRMLSYAILSEQVANLIPQTSVLLLPMKQDSNALITHLIVLMNSTPSSNEIMETNLILPKISPVHNFTTVVHLIAGRHLIAGTPPNMTQVKIREYLKMETLIEHD
jgi:hypothetical protein